VTVEEMFLTRVVAALDDCDYLRKWAVELDVKPLLDRLNPDSIV
jgi:hypothetical protein